MKNVKENFEIEKEKLKEAKKRKMNNGMIPYDIVLCLLFGVTIGMLSGDIVKALLFGILYGMLCSFFIDFVKNMD